MAHYSRWGGWAASASAGPSEEKEGAGYPVETKHGSVPRGTGRPACRDDDAVHPCAQGLLQADGGARRPGRGDRELTADYSSSSSRTRIVSSVTRLRARSLVRRASQPAASAAATWKASPSVSP